MKILYFAPIYFDDLKQRPQQIAIQLAKKHEVIYVEPTISWIRYYLKGGRDYRGDRRQEQNLTIIRLDGRHTFHKSIEILDLFGWNNISECHQIRKYADDSDLLWVGYTGWYTVVRHFLHKPMVWDVMDQEEKLVGNILLRASLRRSFHHMREKACQIIVTSRALGDMIGKDYVLIPNGVPHNFVSDRIEIQYGLVEKIEKAGYIGTIAEWFDMEAIQVLLDNDPKLEIFLVGKNLITVYHHERLHYLGEKKHEELPEIMSQWQLCLYPFKRDYLLDTINPVKIYEYLAMNKPVLASRSRETEIFSRQILLYNELEEIPNLIKEVKQTPFLTRDERTAFINNNSWEKRGDVINNTIERSL